MNDIILGTFKMYEKVLCDFWKLYSYQHKYFPTYVMIKLGWIIMRSICFWFSDFFAAHWSNGSAVTFLYGCELYSPNISYATFPFFYKNLLHVDIIGERKKSKKILVTADARFYETIE